jgi:hypothetical protein
MLHGLFHHIQPELKLMPSDGFNEHLDTLEGRVWMQLEWRALRRALESSGSDRIEAIADALAFRRERRRLFPRAADNERRDEIREGLASYTGVAAWADSPADARRAAAVAADLAAPLRQELVQHTVGGPGPWRLARLGNRQAADDECCRGSGTLRCGNAANGEEDARSGAAGPRRRAAPTLRRWAVLTMPAAGSGTSDTTGSVGIPGVGTVFFRTFTLSAWWGRLTANDGVLRAADGTTLSVPVTGPLEGTALQGGTVGPPL